MGLSFVAQKMEMRLTLQIFLLQGRKLINASEENDVVTMASLLNSGADIEALDWKKV